MNTREEIGSNKTAGHDLKSVSMRSRMTYSRLIGALFLAAFLLYGLGFGLVTSAVGAPVSLSTISAHQSTLVLGAFMMLLNSVAVVAIGVLFFPILEQYGKRTAVAYLTARIVEGVFLAVGVLSLLMMLPLAQQAVNAENAAWAAGLGSLATQWNTMAYQIAMMSLGLASLFVCWLLFQTRLIPRFISAWGFVGYAIFMAGAIAEIFGIHIGVLLSVPGGLFELVLGFWLIIKGFQPEAYSGHAEDAKTSDVRPASATL
ncbi:MAG TPA: DUF4386 domain-containing protein [Anaerolineales bacterium]|nr:DUF4386 domain-containing protein [Anaerolineales bacterium]